MTAREAVGALAASSPDDAARLASLLERGADEGLVRELAESMASRDETLAIVGAEAAAAEDENASLSSRHAESQARVRELEARVTEVVTRGAFLSQHVRQLTENREYDDYRAYGQRSERVRPGEGDGPTAGDADAIATCEWFESQPEVAGAGTPAAKGRRRGKRGDGAGADGSAPEATGEEAFAEMDEDELDGLAGVREDIEAARARAGARHGGGGQQQRVGRRQTTVDERATRVEHAYVARMPDGSDLEFGSMGEARAALAAAGAERGLSLVSLDEREGYGARAVAVTVVHVVTAKYRARVVATGLAEAKAVVAGSLSSDAALRVDGLGGNGAGVRTDAVADAVTGEGAEGTANGGADGRGARRCDGSGGPGAHARGADAKRRRFDVFVSTVARRPFVGGSRLTPSLAALMVTLLVCAAVPVSRQLTSTALLAAARIPVSTAEHWMTLLYRGRLCLLMPYLREALVSQGYLHADETPVRVLRQASRKGYLWLYSTLAGCDTPVRYFDYAPGRGGKHALRVLEGFAGVLITDAYGGYNLLECVSHAFCLIHARRKFYEAWRCSTLTLQTTRARALLDAFADIFAVEATLRGMPPDERLAERRRLMLPLVRRIDRLCDEAAADPCVPRKGKLMGAVAYWRNNRGPLTAFLDDGEIPLHNMTAEGMARAASAWRRNSQFCGSALGGEARACMLTVTETARANGLDPYSYIEWALENMPDGTDGKDRSLMLSLLPWSERARAEVEPLAAPVADDHGLVGGGWAA